MHDLFSELKWRGLVHQSTDPELGPKLLAGPFTVYNGLDPSSKSLHIGNLLGLVVLARFQKAGHKAIALAGGGTGFIGDPSGKSEERALLTAEQLAENVAGIQGEITRIFTHCGAGNIPLLNNADWLCKLSFIEFLRDVGKHFTVNVMLEKESVRARLEDRQHGISYTEFSYMLLQAYDFLHLYDHPEYRCRLQVGGSDQFGNITAGCELLRRRNHLQPAKDHGSAFGLTWPLILRSDGKKFGKTEAGAVWLSPERTSPYEFYQFWINTPDADAGRLLRFITELSKEEIEALERQTAAEPQKRAAQKVLAQKVTELVHGPDERAKAEKASVALFGGGKSKEGALADLDEATLLELVKEAPSAALPKARLDGDGAGLLDLMAESGLWPSKSEAKRAIQGGGASLNNTKVSDLGRKVTAADLLHGKYLLLRKGKKEYFLFKAE